MSLKDKISNIVAIIAGALGVLQVVIVAWNDYVASSPDPNVAISWPQLLLTVAIAVIGWLTGKPGDLKKPTP